MLKIKYLISCVFLFFISLYTSIAQEIQILSQEDKSPISFASIAFKVNGSIIDGTHANDSGKVFLFLKFEVDSIEIFQFGYQTLCIHKNDIKKEIYLQEEVTYLEEINLATTKKSGKKNRIKKMGYPVKYKGVAWSSTLTPEVVAFIENTLKQDKKVKSFSFRLSNRADASPIYKIVFYSKKDDRVGKSLIRNSQKQIFTLKSGQIKVKLDITDLEIVIPKEGFFVGIEYIGYIDNNTNQTILKRKNIQVATTIETTISSICLLKSKDENAKFVYARDRFNELMKDWYKMSIYKKNVFSTLLEEDEYFVPAFGIEVYE